MNFPRRKPGRHNATGFSLVELLIVITIAGIISAIGLISFQKSNRSFKVSGATRELSGYLEKARAESVRRHGGASLDIDSSSSYTANIDFSGSGTSTPRTIPFPLGTSLRYTLPPATTSIDPSVTPIRIDYDWRGRTTTTVLLTLTDSTAGVAPSTLVVGPVGDLSTDTTVTGPVTAPTLQNTGVTTTTGIKSMRN